MLKERARVGDFAASKIQDAGKDVFGKIHSSNIGEKL